MMPRERYKLLIVDDSRMMRKAIVNIFAAHDSIEVVGEASHGKEALEMILQINPDVVTLDVNMPVMDGLTTLKHMMIEAPKPTVMLSSLTAEGATVTFDALKYGAVDFITKPSKLERQGLDGQEKEIANKVALAAQVEIGCLKYTRILPKDSLGNHRGPISCRAIAAIGAAEGGYGALLKLIPRLKPDLPTAFFVILYAEAPYIDPFIAYLQQCSSIRVQRAVSGVQIEGGTCYIARGGEYVSIRPEGGELLILVNQSPFTHKGSINMLMFSASEIFQKNTLGVVLTGSGLDGVEGAGEILRNGGRILVQDPATCLHKEAARAVLEQHPRGELVPDTEMASVINRYSE